jgi:hypothetical protein
VPGRAHVFQARQTLTWETTQRSLSQALGWLWSSMHKLTLWVEEPASLPIAILLQLRRSCLP